MGAPSLHGVTLSGANRAMPDCSLRSLRFAFGGLFVVASEERVRPLLLTTARETRQNGGHGIEGHSPRGRGIRRRVSNKSAR